MLDLFLAAALEVAAVNQQDTFNPARPMVSEHSVVVDAAATFPRGWQRFASCVLRRETGGVLGNRASREDARSSLSSSAGRWQFLAAWQSGGAHMVRKRLVAHGMPKADAKRVRGYLSKRPIYEWPGVYQDVLFIEAVRQPGGWRHWYKAGSPCNVMVPAGAR
jgi:hypothetical protein